jgi:hypothetical protein
MVVDPTLIKVSFPHLMMERDKAEKGANPPLKKPSRYYRGPMTAATTSKTEPEFQGRCDDFRGHVFDCNVRKQADK